MEEVKLESNKMREQPIGRLLLAMSIPAIFSMLVQALYNIVDSIFVSMQYGQVGTMALSISSPMQYLALAFAIGIGVGTNVQIAKKLGEGKKEEASQIAKNGLFLSVCAAVLFIIVGFTVVKPFINKFANGNQQVSEIGITYLTICLVGSGGMFIEVLCSKVFQATGNMKIPMISQLMGAIINIVLDPIFIFVFKMGVQGAAIATIIGQFASMIFVITMFIVKKHEVTISPKGFRPSKQHILTICKIGFPTMVMNAVNSFTIIILYTILQHTMIKPLSEDGIAILGIYLKLNSFVFMPIFGMTQGLMPILSYNYGYGDKARYNKAYKLGLMSGIVIMAVGTLLFQTIPKPLMMMFSAKGDYLHEGIVALRIISICFIPAAFNIVNTTCMQSLGNGVTSLIMSLLRQVVVLIPIAALLAITVKLRGFWFAYPIAECSVFLIFTPIAIKIISKKFASLAKETSGAGSDGDGDFGASPDASSPFLELSETAPTQVVSPMNLSEISITGNVVKSFISDKMSGRDIVVEGINLNSDSDESDAEIVKDGRAESLEILEKTPRN